MGTNRLALYNDPEETQRQVLDGRQVQIWTALPCIVKAVDFSQMTIEAQPTIQGSFEDENGILQYVNLPLLLDVPVVFPSAGGFTITFPIAVNDEVLVIFSSRCIDSWFQSGGIQKPMETRMHDLSDGFCIPGPKSLPHVLPNVSTTDLQIRKNDGTKFISLKADGSVEITANVHITGTLVVSGEITGNAIPLSTHRHPQTAGADTLGPIV